MKTKNLVFIEISDLPKVKELYIQNIHKLVNIALPPKSTYGDLFSLVKKRFEDDDASTIAANEFIQCNKDYWKSDYSEVIINETENEVYAIFDLREGE